MQEQINSAVTLYSSGQIQKALDLVKSLINDNSKEAILHNIAGACYSSLGQLTDAIDSFNEAIKIKPDYADAFFNIGNAFKDQNKFDNAIEAYKKSILIKPAYASAYLNMGVIFKDLGKLEKSKGRNVWIATIRIRSDKRMLKLKKISSKIVGSGKTIIATMNKIPNGNTASLRYRRDQENPNVSKFAT